MSLFGNKNDPHAHPSRVLFGGGYQAEEDPLPTEVVALQSIIHRLQDELKATTSVNTHLAASIARLQAERPTATPTTTALSTPTTTASLPGTTAASGRGAASPEVFQRILKTNWHGRLGRAHMADVDALPPAALMELDSLLRRKLQRIFPHSANHTEVDAENIFACLASLGLRLEDRARYVDARIVGDITICSDSTVKRARTLSAYYHANKTMRHNGYWRGFVLETMVELARYRGLFDDEGYLVVE